MIVYRYEAGFSRFDLFGGADANAYIPTARRDAGVVVASPRRRASSTRTVRTLATATSARITNLSMNPSFATSAVELVSPAASVPPEDYFFGAGDGIYLCS